MIVPKKLIEKWRVLSVILIASSIILAGGAYYYNYSIKLLRKQKENELYVIAKYKIAQMQQWKVERTADIKSIAESPFFEKGVEEWLLNRASEYVKEGIKESLDAAKNILDYEDVFLTSKTGVMLIGKDGFGKKGEPELIATINYAAEKNYTVHSDFYYCSEHKKIHYDIVAPIHNAKNEVIACIVFRIDPYDYMYPLIQSWPTESKTAETLLFKKEGDYVLYLNELRHKTNTALKFRLPLAADKLPAAQAIKGTTGFFTGIDYRGVEVISYLSPISGTEWYIVAKVDSDEILAAVKERSFLIIVIVLLLLLSVSSGIIWLYYYRQRNIYRNLNLVQEEFKTTLYSIGDAVISTDKEGRVKNMNKVAETLTGWSEKDAYGKKLTEVFVIINEVTREIVESPVEKVLLNGEVVDLANHTVLISKDGQEYQIADSAAPIKNHAGEITGIVMVFSDVTEKYLKDQKVRESERVLSTLVSNLPGMAYRCANDYDWTMRFISDSCYKITGYYASDFIDNKKVKFNDIILEEYRELLWEEWQKVLSAKETFTYEYKIRKANGEIRWVWERGLGVYDDSGKLLFLEGYIEDINERKVAEEELRKSREELVKFFEDDVAANLISTPEGKLIYCNKTYLDLFGFKSLEEAKNYPIDQLYINSPNRAEFLQTLNSVKKLEHYEAALKTLDGRIIHTIENTTGIFDDAGNLVQIRSYLVDITKLKTVEAATKKLSRAVEQSPASVIITDNEGNIEYVNQKFTLVTGYSFEEVAGKNPRIFKSDFHDQEFYASLWKTLLSTKEWSGEMLNKKKNGELYWESTLISPLVSSDNQITHFVAIKEDITQKKMMIEELIKTKELAERAIKLKDAFIANMSHEIRTPLNGMLGMISIIKESYVQHITNEDYKLFDGINNSSNRLIRTVDMILNYSRLQVGDFLPLSENIDLAPICEDLIGEFQIAARNNSIELSFENLCGETKLYADSYSITIALSNLIDNAIKFTNKGFVKLVLYKESNNLIKMDVRDSGKGIGKDFIPYIFSPYSQEEVGYTRSYEGVGLGLSLVKKFLNLNNADISVISEIGEGSTFTITFFDSVNYS